MLRHGKAVKVVVASRNPAKVEAVRSGFALMFPGVIASLEAVSAASGVSDQPMSREETLQGARGRVQDARKLAPDADYYVGLEGGCGLDSVGLYCQAYVVISDGQREGVAQSAAFYLPPAVAKLVVEDGLELGHANDRVFQQHNSKQQTGAVGILTNDIITRTSFLQQVACLCQHL